MNVPSNRRRRGSRRSSRRSETEENENEEDLDWRYLHSNKKVFEITNSDPIQHFCLIQHLKFIAHITRLPSYAPQKQVLFRKNKKKNASDPWKKYVEITQISKEQLLTEMQDKTGFLTILDNLQVTPHTATVSRGRR